MYHSSDSLHISHSYMWIKERETAVIYPGVISIVHLLVIIKIIKDARYMY
jgi:hypothetical protein